MERKLGTTDAEWEAALQAQKEKAEYAMQRADNMNGFVTLEYLTRAAATWKTDLHSAEIRLLNGEMP